MSFSSNVKIFGQSIVSLDFRSGLYVCMPQIGKGKVGRSGISSGGEWPGDFKKSHELFHKICSKRLIPDSGTHTKMIDGYYKSGKIDFVLHHLDVSVPILTRVNEWVKFQGGVWRNVVLNDGYTDILGNNKDQKSSKSLSTGRSVRFEKWWGEARQVRFLYSICPLICIAVAAVIQSFLDFLYERYRSEKSSRYKIAKFKRPSFIGLNLCPFRDLLCHFGHHTTKEDW
ncbi:hypothetical protein Tco_0659914 [Tanacetum coccineum]